MDYSGVESSTVPDYLPAVEKQTWIITEEALTNSTVACELLELQRAAYGIEAALIGYLDFPPLRQTLEELQRATDTFLVLWAGGRMAGVLSYVAEGEMLEVTRLIVSPSCFRQGIATHLLSELERRCPDVKRVCVTTAEMNVPAIRLYLKAGYVTSDVTRSSEGIRLVHLRKTRVTHAPLKQQR